jgi:hypothetical protein
VCSSDLVIQKEGSPSQSLVSGKLVEAEYRTPMAYHAYLEPMAAVADVRPDKVEVWASTQAASRLRGAVAEATGHHHRIHAPQQRIGTALLEASDPSFKDYAARIVTNARTLADALTAHGFTLVSGGTDNHLLLVDLSPTGPGRGICSGDTVLLADVGNSRIKLARLDDFAGGSGLPTVARRQDLDSRGFHPDNLERWLLAVAPGPAVILVASVYEAAATRLEAAVAEISATKHRPVRQRQIFSGV